MSVERIRELEKRVRYLETIISKLPVRVKPGGGGGGSRGNGIFDCPIVSVLPAITAGQSEMQFVRWSKVAGTANQIWIAHGIDSEWTPLQIYTPDSGEIV